eukprot:5882747-Prymnesium_polylepis.1
MGGSVGQPLGWEVKTVTCWSVDRSVASFGWSGRSRWGWGSRSVGPHCARTWGHTSGFTAVLPAP